ncbi:uncharacterized protein LY89DRAFT_689916 [Mollisia scopiformis]|uniref:Uncharacterized protein n=1 Tax=Mollisia scopiformis TaxID=149040 RepID=A0A132BEH1_MOLSC|nr:uncharacterized protein LY89DRAFT_689916 [Mollisia scopiformis]KUJ10077.1 hypothetical protein LY89DRAFT_689916 [Mollisia scopiformis]
MEHLTDAEFQQEIRKHQERIRQRDAAGLRPPGTSAWTGLSPADRETAFQIVREMARRRRLRGEPKPPRPTRICTEDDMNIGHDQIHAIAATRQQAYARLQAAQNGGVGVGYGSERPGSGIQGSGGGYGRRLSGSQAELLRKQLDVMNRRGSGSGGSQSGKSKKRSEYPPGSGRG